MNTCERKIEKEIKTRWISQTMWPYSSHRRITHTESCHRSLVIVWFWLDRKFVDFYFLVGWNDHVATGDIIIRRCPLSPWLLPFLHERKFLKTDKSEEKVLELMTDTIHLIPHHHCRWHYPHNVCVHMYAALCFLHFNKQLHHYPLSDWSLFCKCTISVIMKWRLRALHCAAWSLLRHWKFSPPGLL